MFQTYDVAASMVFTAATGLVITMTAPGDVAISIAQGAIQMATDERIQFSDADEYIYGDGSRIIFGIGGSNEVGIDAAKIYPTTNRGSDLGSSGSVWANSYADTRWGYSAAQGVLFGHPRLSIGNVAGIARTFDFVMPIIAGGAPGNELAWEFEFDGAEIFGVHAETDGGGGYQNPVVTIPYEVIAGPGEVAPALPAGAGNGALKLQYNTAGGTSRLYGYSNGGWVSVLLA